MDDAQAGEIREIDTKNYPIHRGGPSPSRTPACKRQYIPHRRWPAWNIGPHEVVGDQLSTALEHLALRHRAVRAAAGGCAANPQEEPEDKIEEGRYYPDGRKPQLTADLAGAQISACYSTFRFRQEFSHSGRVVIKHLSACKLAFSKSVEPEYLSVEPNTFRAHTALMP